MGALSVDHQENVRVSSGATVESLQAWLQSVPPQARISVSHSQLDRGTGSEYTIRANWTSSAAEKVI